jgi:fructokinase
MLTGLSRDMFGQMLEDGLHASGVDTSFIIRSDRPTTLAFVSLAGGQARYSFHDENSAGRMLRPEHMSVLPDTVSVLFFGGISLACEPCAEAYAALLERSHEGRVIMIDPNIRPGFIKDAGAYRARLERMMRLADIVKFSDEDLEWFLPEPVSIREKAGRIAALGPAIIVVTRGANGATAFRKNGGDVTVPAVETEVVDTVGAGDTFNAGVLAKLSELGCLHPEALAALSEDVLAAALGHGASAAAVTVSRRGANPPRTDELAP